MGMGRVTVLEGVAQWEGDTGGQTWQVREWVMQVLESVAKGKHSKCKDFSVGWVGLSGTDQEPVWLDKPTLGRIIGGACWRVSRSSWMACSSGVMWLGGANWQARSREQGDQWEAFAIIWAKWRQPDQSSSSRGCGKLDSGYILKIRVNGLDRSCERDNWRMIPRFWPVWLD